jgi:hypothetical protein
VNDVAEPAHGLMVLSLWVEHGGQLRVRVVNTPDVRSHERRTAYCSSKDEVLDAVETWLDAFVTSR